MMITSSFLEEVRLKTLITGLRIFPGLRCRVSMLRESDSRLVRRGRGKASLEIGELGSDETSEAGSGVAGEISFPSFCSSSGGGKAPLPNSH